MLKVKDVMQITGLSRRALQYYDEIGLMHTQRTALNYRVYSDADLERLWQIQVYKEMGFKLNEIRRLLKVNDEQRKQLLDKKLKQIDKKMDVLDREYRFVEKVKDNGIPPRRAVKSKVGMFTYSELVKILAEQME